MHFCGPCAVGAHDLCPGIGSTCGCAQIEHKLEHPAISGGLYNEKVGKRYGEMRDVDYELEPYETRSFNETGATKSKPRDDLEAARSAQQRTAMYDQLF